MSSHLTHFQMDARERISSLTANLGLRTEGDLVRVVTVPMYDKEPQAIVEGTAQGVRWWIYDDEASLSDGGTTIVFERFDYVSPEALLAHFLSELTRSLGGERLSEEGVRTRARLFR